MQQAILPFRYVGISQGCYGTTSHIGLKAIDFGWNSKYLAKSKTLYAPFDGKIVWRKGTTNCIAFQSNEKVKYADGTEDYMTVISCHDNNAPKVGATFKQGEAYSRSGTAGGVALHTHLEVQKGKFQTYTSIKNTSSSGKYSSYIFPNTVLPYEALFVVKDTIYSTGGVKYEWKEVSDMTDLIKIEKDSNYDYKWSVDGNKYGDQYDITTQGGFSDTSLVNDGWEEVLKVNGSLFYEYDSKHYACGLEKSRGTNNQELEMTAVTDYNTCMAIAGVDNEIYYASQEYVIKNLLDKAYCAITGLGLIFNGVARDDMHKGFETQWNQVSGRTVIGETKDGDILSYSFAGTTGTSGLTGKQVQAKCLELGFYNAIMLDGGGSVFREHNGSYDISTTRKVKNALILYRRKKGTEDSNPDDTTTDWEDAYNAIKAKYDELESEYSTLQKNYDVLKDDNTSLENEKVELNNLLSETKNELETSQNEREKLSTLLAKVKELVNE